MVVDIIYHPSVDHYLRFVALTIGRDKVLRLLQYFSRFAAWYLFRTNHTQPTITPFEVVKKHFGLTRKIMRVGKFVEHFKAAAAAADAKAMDPVLRYCAVGRQLGYAGYMTLDCLTVADAAGIYKTESAKRLQREAYRCWLAGLTFNVVAGVYSLWRLQQRATAVEKLESGESAVESKKIQKEGEAAQLQLISDVCDLTIPSTALGLASFDDGIVGIAGCVSSLIGIAAVWTKTA